MPFRKQNSNLHGCLFKLAALFFLVMIFSFVAPSAFAQSHCFDIFHGSPHLRSGLFFQLKITELVDSLSDPLVEIPQSFVATSPIGGKVTILIHIKNSADRQRLLAYNSVKIDPRVSLLGTIVIEPNTQSPLFNVTKVKINSTNVSITPHNNVVPSSILKFPSNSPEKQPSAQFSLWPNNPDHYDGQMNF